MAQQDDHDPAAFLANLAGTESSAPKPADKPAPRPQAPTGRPETPVAAEREADDEDIDGEIEAELEGEIEDDEDEQVAAIPSPRSSAARRMPPSRKKKGGNLKATAAPILLTVGILLLGPAIWGVAILGGSKTVMGADREDAPMMAKLMQVCWPIAVVLIVSAIVIFVQVAREAKQAKARG